MHGMNAARREALRLEVERLSDLPTSWALRSNPMMSPLVKAHIYLRTAGYKTYGWPNRIREDAPPGGTSLQTTMAQSARAHIEMRIVSYQPDLEANEVAAMMVLRFARGGSVPRLNPFGMAYLGFADLVELPAEHESEQCLSVCLATLQIGLAEIDTVVDGFDTWIDDVTLGPVRLTDPDGVEFP